MDNKGYEAKVPELQVGAEAGDPEAMYHLAQRYRKGREDLADGTLVALAYADRSTFSARHGDAPCLTLATSRLVDQMESLKSMTLILNPGMQACYSISRRNPDHA